MRFIHLALALTIIFFGTILTSRFVGATQANPIAVLFTNPDGSPCQMPCLFGVRPGVATLDEGLQILHKHLLTHGMEVQPSKDGVVLYSADSWIDLTLTQHKTIITMVLHYQCPICMSFSPGGAKSKLTSPDIVNAMQHGVLGNQLLYFGRSDGGDGLAFFADSDGS